MAMAAALSKVIRGGGSRAAQSRLLLLPAMGRSRGPQEGFVGRLLPAMGATAPASTAPASPPLLRKQVPSPCPAIPWRFHLMAGMQSSTHAGEQEQLVRAPPPADANKEYVARIKKLYSELETMEASFKQLDAMRWLCTGLLLYYATAILPEHLVRLWDLMEKNSKLARKLPEAIKGAEELKDQIAHHHEELRDLQEAAASVKPASAIPSATTPSSLADV